MTVPTVPMYSTLLEDNIHMIYRIIEVDSKQDYNDLLDIAFKNSDAFSVCTFKYYHKKNLSQGYYDFLSALEPYKIIEEYGIPKNYRKGQKYHVYELNSTTMKLIWTLGTLQAWEPPLFPEDLTFYIHKRYWLYTISHENLIFMRPPHQDVLKLFLNSHFELVEQLPR